MIDLVLSLSLTISAFILGVAAGILIFVGLAWDLICHQSEKKPKTR